MELSALSDSDKLLWKNSLKLTCVNILDDHINSAIAAMHEAQDSANGEEKSSMGDKYETSRAMGHISRDMHARQYEEAKKQLQLLNMINFDRLFDKVLPGAVALCSTGIYFVSTGLGSLEVDGMKIHFISAQAPIAIVLLNKKKGEEFMFNNKTVKINEIF